MNIKQKQEFLDHVISNLILIPMDGQLYSRLADWCRDDNGEGSTGEVARVMEHQLWGFLERMESMGQEKPLGKSVYWHDKKQTGKTFELPHGTEIRTKRYKELIIAKVVDGSILWNGREFSSPASACNAMRGGTSNNAWVRLDVKRPKDPDFMPAVLLRN